MELQLFETIEKFVQLTKDLDEPDLEKPWAWHSYDGEGVRFAFFRTYEELQELAVKLELERVNLGYPLTSTQRILGQYHVAFRSLEAVLLAVDSEIEEVPPAEGEWSIRETLAHILRADIGFYIVIRHALDRFRAGDLRPEEISDEVAERILGLDEKAYNSLLEGSYENLRRFHTEHHQRILDDFGGISEQELEVGSKYWEDEEMSLRFRLHRFDSHMRQHTIQVEKALSDLDHAPNEINRLHRMIYCALADCENKLIGSPVVGEALRNELIKTIHTRVEEIAALV